MICIMLNDFKDIFCVFVGIPGSDPKGVLESLSTSERAKFKLGMLCTSFILNTGKSFDVAPLIAP